MASLSLLNAPVLRQPQGLLGCSWVALKTKPCSTSCRSSSEDSNHGMMSSSKSRTPSPDYVRILDTTLRDGEQSPGVALSPCQKLEIAKQLAKLRVDVIDAGFPATSRQEAEAVRRIAEDVGGTEDATGYAPVISAFSRCVKSDIDAAWEAVRGAKRPRILTFISTSEIHMKYKLNKSPEEVLAIAVEMVAYARSLGCQDIQFGAEDSGRTKLEFLCDVFEGVIAAGASTVGLGDTVGYLFPTEFANMVTKVKENTRGIEQAVISCHCHNDLGLATSNTLAAGLAGARQLEVSINGIGERAGNASLEEVVMAMKCRRKGAMQGLYTGIETRHIFPTSQMVAEYTGMLVQPNKAIVGANAFAHESGIHQDGMLKHRETYEILSPSDVGIVKTDEDSIVLGKHSGRHALNARLAQLGYKLGSEDLGEVFKRFKVVAEEKKIVTNLDLKALVAHY